MANSRHCMTRSLLRPSQQLLWLLAPRYGSLARRFGHTPLWQNDKSAIDSLLKQRKLTKSTTPEKPVLDVSKTISAPMPRALKDTRPIFKTMTEWKEKQNLPNLPKLQPLKLPLLTLQPKKPTKPADVPATSTTPPTDQQVAQARQDIMPSWQRPASNQNLQTAANLDQPSILKVLEEEEIDEVEDAESYYEQRRQSRQITRPSRVTIDRPQKFWELASLLHIRKEDLLYMCRQQGLDLQDQYDVIGMEDCQLMGSELGIEVRIAPQKQILKRRPPPTDPSVLVKRPPIVTVMGHVDHGKTTLLDSLRSASVAASEAGGITQHIGAFLVTLPSGNKITFLDTPGHVAFSNMRARGANLTDIVVLVVAKDDGIMPQTIEAIRHAQAAKAPIIVALNKCDKELQHTPPVYQDLMRYELHPEQMGGDVQVIEISALKKKNLDLLEEAIVAQAELMELKGDPTGMVEAVVIESKMEKGRGNVTTLMIQRGTLKVGDFLVCGTTYTRVKQIIDDHGKQIKQATLGCPVEIDGWRELPPAGTEVFQAENEAVVKESISASEIVEYLERQPKENEQTEFNIARYTELSLEKRYLKSLKRRRLLMPDQVNKLNNLLKTFNDSLKEVNKENFIIKGDVSGTVEAIVAMVSPLVSGKISVKLVDSAVGQITTSDVSLAETSNSTIIGFNVKPNKDAVHLAKQVGVKIKLHSIIYKLLEDVQEQLEDAAKSKEVLLGEAEVLAKFDLPNGMVAGLRVKTGEIQRNGKFRVFRKGSLVFEGPSESLKIFKKAAEVVSKGQECGLALQSFGQYEVGDVIKCYKDDTVAPEAAAAAS